MKKNILLTGANGFVGYNIYKLFDKKKYNIICLIKKKNVHIKNYVICDLSKKIKLNKQINIDAIIHCAGSDKGQNFFKFYKNNILATQNLVDFANLNKVKKFIFLSSISVYGYINNKKLKINSEIISPELYGLSKLICEKSIQDKKNKFKSISIRLPGIIGKGSKKNFISRLYKNISSSKQIKIFNPNSLFNNCIDVEELSKFIFQLIKVNFKKHDILLVGSSNPIRIIDVVNLMMTNVKSKSKIKILKNERNSFLIENTYANQNYKYKPTSTYSTITKFIKLNI